MSLLRFTFAIHGFTGLNILCQNKVMSICFEMNQNGLKLTTWKKN